MKWMFIEKMPSTNFRIFISLILATATGIVVLIRWTAPPWEWMVFLGGMMGLDVLQFKVKRETQQTPPPGAEPGA